MGIVVIVAENAEKGYRRVAEEERKQSDRAFAAEKENRGLPKGERADAEVHQIKFVGITPYLTGLHAKRGASLSEALDEGRVSGDVVRLVKDKNWECGKEERFVREVERLEGELREAGLVVTEA